MATTRKKQASTKKTAGQKVIPAKVTAKKSADTAKPATKKAVKQPASTTKSGIPPIRVSPEDRWKMIAVAAYHRAEKRGFAPGDEVQDWLEAEAEIDRLLSG